MNFTPRPITQHRRARLIAWTLAMLGWLVQVLFAGAIFTDRHERQRARTMSLVALMRRVKLLIVSRALDLARVRCRLPRRQGFRHLRNTLPRGFLNAALGARVRRMLKRKTLADRIAVLIDAIRHLDDYAALVASRIKRGLTRRWSAQFAAPLATPGAHVACLAAPEACFADSS